MVIFRLFVLATLFLAVSALFFGCGGGGGGGGGCGGGCGGCRTGCRAKRETNLLEAYMRTSSELPCTQNEWRKVIEQAVNSTSGPSDAEMRIQAVMHEMFEGAKFFVSCANLGTSGAPPRFTASGEAYCGHGNENVWCTVVAMYA